MANLTAKKIGEKLNLTPKEINDIFIELNFIKKCDKGYEITDLGKQNAGEQKFYMGNSFIIWDEKILNNELFLKMIKPENEIKENIEIDFRKKFQAQYRTKSGHYVRSRAEVIIADWLYSEYICFAYEKRVPILEDIYCDFYLPKEKIFIEFWGYEEDEKYIERKNKKLELYKKYNLNLIEIDNKIINNIDDILPREILKFK
ncbi:PDDEXK family nuclease [Campylobacter portucalensis]|nr:hypothetical protein [Campylobacter portucalensis]